MGRGRGRPTGAVDRLPSGRWRVRIADPAADRRVSIGSYKTKAEAEAASWRPCAEPATRRRGDARRRSRDPGRVRAALAHHAA